MTREGDEHERTIGFADAALERIRAFRHAAYPKNYDFWFTYATGFNAELNRAVNEAIANGGAIGEKEVEALYQMHVTPARLSNKMDEVGAKIVDEINQVMSMIDAAKGNAAAYDQSLNGIEATLVNLEDDRDQVRLIVESLVHATREMQQVNLELENRLTETRREMVQLQENLEAIRAESLTDPLTQLSNRKYLDAALEKCLLEAQRGERSFSILVTDIDHFKTFNDTHGHLTGDQVLRLVAMAIKHNVKGQDIAARYGGEEFAIILPDTPLRAAVILGDHIRRAVMGKELVKRSTGENLGRITMSIGVATYREGDTAQTIVERADQCLYAAKHAGRNRVVCETDPEVALPPVSNRVA